MILDRADCSTYVLPNWHCWGCFLWAGGQSQAVYLQALFVDTGAVTIAVGASTVAKYCLQRQWHPAGTNYSFPRPLHVAHTKTQSTHTHTHTHTHTTELVQSTSIGSLSDLSRALPTELLTKHFHILIYSFSRSHSPPRERIGLNGHNITTTVFA
jgi:hypothetical protein